MTRRPIAAYLDSSDFTHLVLCRLCTQRFGPYLSKDTAMSVRIAHNYEHRCEDKAAAAFARYHRDEEA